MNWTEQATRCLSIVWTVIRRLLLIILTLVWLAAISPLLGELTIVFVVYSFNLSQTLSKTSFNLIPEVSKNVFVQGLHLQALVNVNMEFELFGVTHSIQTDQQQKISL